MKFRIWEKSIQDERLKNILKSFQENSSTDATEYFADADADVIFGSWKDRDVEHHNIKRDVVKNSNNLIVMETPLLGRVQVESIMPDDWVRVGLNGFMRNAQYPKVSNERFQKILADTGVGDSLKMETEKDGDYILVVLQLPGDASLDFVDINKWVKDTVTEIRKITDRDTVIRFPQLPREYDLEFTKEFKGIYFQHGKFKDKEVTFKNAYAVITYSSGMGVEAILNSRRTLIQSENGFYSRRSTLEEVLQKDYENFESTEEFDKWLDLIVSTQWHKDEIASGGCRRAFEELITDGR